MVMAATFPASLISGSAAISMLPRTPLLPIHQVLLYIVVNHISSAFGSFIATFLF
jgi:hypothetical protein